MADQIKVLTDCPACKSTSLSEIYRLDAIPVQSCILLDTLKEAQEFPAAPMVLMFCDECGLVFNSVFDLNKVEYASATEESQHFSDTFNRFAKKLAAEIAEHWSLKGKYVLEIGCGKGEFLRELVERTGATGLGVDPGFVPERLTVERGVELSFQREYFTPKNISIAPDFVICRHTLEHIPKLKEFMQDIVTVIGKGKNVGIFFETPDVRRVLAEGAFWDIYYEHCSYFTLGSHARLFRNAGLNVSKLYLDYDDQYIIQYAETSEDTGTLLEQEHDLDEVRALIAKFPEKIEKVRNYWTDFVTSRKADGKSVAIWGGGSKGVSFLTTNAVRKMIDRVIDINTFKQGKYLPVTGHQVSAPEALCDDPPDTVIVMNPIYLPEISAQLQSLGLNPELVAV